MLLTIAILVLATIAVAALRLAPPAKAPRVRFDTVPDRPLPFGYKMSWVAVRTENTEHVRDTLGLLDARPANWSSGIGAVYDDDLGRSHVFVTPPVAGFVLVVGLALPLPVGPGFVDKCTPMLLALGQEFDDVQYYFSYPLIDFFSWVRVLDGRLQRAFAIGDEGIVWNKGRPTREERALGLKLFELRGVKDRRGDAGGEMLLHPTEAHVLELAGAWGLDPTSLRADDGRPALGRICRVPPHWRPERVRKAA